MTDVLAGGDELDPGLVVVAATYSGIGGIEHQQHVRGQGAVQPFHFVERHIGAGRIVGVGQKDDLVRSLTAARIASTSAV
jgi:hypothetical protein